MKFFMLVCQTDILQNLIAGLIKWFPNQTAIMKFMAIRGQTHWRSWVLHSIIQPIESYSPIPKPKLPKQTSSSSSGLSCGGMATPSPLDTWLEFPLSTVWPRMRPKQSNNQIWCSLGWLCVSHCWAPLLWPSFIQSVLGSPGQGTERRTGMWAPDLLEDLSPEENVLTANVRSTRRKTADQNCMASLLTSEDLYRQHYRNGNPFESIGNLINWTESTNIYNGSQSLHGSGSVLWTRGIQHILYDHIWPAWICTLHPLQQNTQCL